jgi:molybdopterin molybdotransferase
MDGYAVRLADVQSAGTRLKVIGSAPAGHPFTGAIRAGEGVRIFTGGVVPQGADAILIQENAEIHGDVIVTTEPASAKHIRPAGLDFRADMILAKAGRRLTPRDLSLIASADIATVNVYRKPRIAFAATGDELSIPGEPRKPGGIVASSGFGLSAYIANWGGDPENLGIVPDEIDAIGDIATRSADADLVVTLGGASVGDHDLVQRALEPKGFVVDFWKIAMRPGKPLIFGRLGDTPFIGLPGNPVSALVCAILFVQPAIRALLGMSETAQALRARTVNALASNDSRQDYLRARLSIRDGETWAEAFSLQDSSMMSTFASADALIVRPPHAAPAQIGDAVPVVGLDAR